MTLRPIIHIALHFLFPGVVARVLFKDNWMKCWGVMILTMVIDADHFFADPVFDPNRCSVGFHPLHSTIAICVYILITFIPKGRIIGIGLLIHIFLDFVDCLWMSY